LFRTIGGGGGGESGSVVRVARTSSSRSTTTTTTVPSVTTATPGYAPYYSRDGNNHQGNVSRFGGSMVNQQGQGQNGSKNK
jgi:hypothetical protein